MPLSQQVLRELKVELASLRQRQDDIGARIKGIEVLLNAEGTARAVPPVAVSDPDRTSSRVLSRIRPRRGVLRARLIQMLRSSALTGTQLAGRLEAEGLRVGGKASLRTRVSHELSRLRRLGVLRKDESGQFQLAAESPSVQVAVQDAFR